MFLNASKMHGAGNDFLVVDESLAAWPRHENFIRNICHRTRGIGADGLILLNRSSSPNAELQMEFYNCDGSRAEMCGNGLRCAALFARNHMLQPGTIRIATDAGILETKIISPETVQIEVPLQGKAREIKIEEFSGWFVNTGVPHWISTTAELAELDLSAIGKNLRNSQILTPEGANISFVQVPEKHSAPILIRTYERGVEAETDACGTAVCAAAAALNQFTHFDFPMSFQTVAGDILKVDFPPEQARLTVPAKVLLTGPAVEVCTVKIKLEKEA